MCTHRKVCFQFLVAILKLSVLTEQGIITFWNGVWFRMARNITFCYIHGEGLFCRLCVCHTTMVIYSNAVFFWYKVRKDRTSWNVHSWVPPFLNSINVTILYLHLFIFSISLPNVTARLAADWWWEKSPKDRHLVKDWAACSVCGSRGRCLGWDEEL